jgi:hypothetical protein
LQAVQADLMNATGEVKISDRGFLHGVAPLLFLAIYSIPLKKILFVESGLSMRAS